MKILVAATSFAANISGIQRHALNLVRCLLTRSEVQSVAVVVAPWQKSLRSALVPVPDSRLSTHVVDIERQSLARNIWYYRELPKLAHRLAADLVHLSFPMPVNRSGYPCPTVVTLHDLYPREIPMNFGFPKFALNRVALSQCLRNVDGIASVSEATRQQLRRYYPSMFGKAVTIHNCVEGEDLMGDEIQISGWTGAPFLLCIAQHRRNKNLAQLVRAYDRLLLSGKMSSATQLIVVGISGPETLALHRMVAERGLKSRVHFLEGLSEAELRWCYRQCAALVAPSITEGFGLPVAEGILAGCRVIASDIPAHREVAGNQCTFVGLEGQSEEKLAAAIYVALQMPKPRPIALPKFSAPVLGEQYARFYRDLIVASGRRAVAESAVGSTASGRRSR